MKKSLLFAALALAGGTAIAQSYPTKPVRVVVPFSPGGGTDLLSRIFAQRMQDMHGQPFTVDNRSGAGGNIGADIVAKSTPDGYTIMITSASITVNVTLYPKLNYSLQRDLIPVSQIAASPLILTVHPSVPAKNVKELIALSKRTKGGLNFGSNGAGTTSHLSGLILARMSGMDIVHIPYKGAGPSITALMTGQSDMGFIAAFSVTPHIKQGRLRGLAASTKRPAPSLPELPTLDSMFPGFETDNWFAIFVPRGTPQPIVDRLHGDLVKILQHPSMKGFIEREGGFPIGNTPKEFAAVIERDIAKYAQAIKLAGARSDR